jgi:hypothetical protein
MGSAQDVLHACRIELNVEDIRWICPGSLELQREEILKGFQYPTVQSPIKRTTKAPGNASLDESAPKGRKPLNGGFKFVTGRPAKRRKARQQTGQSHFNIGASPKAATESPATTEYGPPSLESVALVQSPYISSAPSPGMSL